MSYARTILETLISMEPSMTGFDPQDKDPYVEYLEDYAGYDRETIAPYVGNYAQPLFSGFVEGYAVFAWYSEGYPDTIAIDVFPGEYSGDESQVCSYEVKDIIALAEAFGY